MIKQSEDENRSFHSLSQSSWQDLPYKNPFPNYLMPGAAIKAFSLLALLPLVAAACYALIPRSLQHQMPIITTVAFLLSVVGAALFLLCLLTYRTVRQRQQLQLNASLAAEAPNDFILYLRSFRRTGAVVVPNNLTRLVDRRLLGNFWDVELALSVSLAEKLPVLAIGAKSNSLGSAKFTSDDESWRHLFERLARQARAIVIVPDDSESTLWELRQILSDQHLRQKVIVIMPPEQHGWLRLFRRLPTVSHSWEQVRQAMGADIPLPLYSPEGAFLLMDESGAQFAQMNLANFHPMQLTKLVTMVIERGFPGFLLNFEAPVIPEYEEGWTSYIDPVWPMVLVVSLVAGSALAPNTVGADATGLALFATFWASAANCVVNSYAFTFTRETLASRRERLRSLFLTEWWCASTWCGLCDAPGVIRHAVNYFFIFGLLSMPYTILAARYKIPSGSMIPTLQPGDFILVNKFTFSIRLPIINKKITQNNPHRGDVMVFKGPEGPSLEHVSRVVGLPGDTIVYREKKVYINGVLQQQRQEGKYKYREAGLNFVPNERYNENLDGHTHGILINTEDPGIHLEGVSEFPHREACSYSHEEVRCTVPDGNYFMLGDNRDTSRDSRYFGFVPDNMMVGKAYLIWMNVDDLKRIGSIN